MASSPPASPPSPGTRPTSQADSTRDLISTSPTVAEEATTIRWTAEQELRLTYCQDQLKQAQRKWSDRQELWIREVRDFILLSLSLSLLSLSCLEDVVEPSVSEICCSKKKEQAAIDESPLPNLHSFLPALNLLSMPHLLASPTPRLPSHTCHHPANPHPPSLSPHRSITSSSSSALT